MSEKIFVSDLTHTAMGVSSLSFPLGASFVASYAQKQFCDTCDFQVFKFPNNLSRAIYEERPKVIGFSNYSWNLEIGYAIAEWAKGLIPGLTVIFGGPNFPVDPEEQAEFLKSYPAIDFYIQNEGEIAFSQILGHLIEHNFDSSGIVAGRLEITNSCFIAGGDLVIGEVERILDVNQIPSPYLSGLLDKFFEDGLAPMIETTRGCPFRCTFCSDGMATKNRVVRFHPDRIREELYYIANHTTTVDELHITDLNFGMYKQDLVTAKVIKDIQAEYEWPLLIKGSAGKNQPSRVIEAASMLNGSWVIGSSVQSTDSEVLANVKRSNISVDAYKEFIQFVNEQGETSQSYSEIILGLPGDTTEKHFNSLKMGIENGVDTLRMFQAMLLLGTDMASGKTRENHHLNTKFRIIPGCIGTYQFGLDTRRVAEIEEIIVGNATMSFEGYKSCRIMNLFIESYYNNGLFEEYFDVLTNLGVAPFDILVDLHGHYTDLPLPMTEIFNNFIREMVDDLFDSHQKAKNVALEPAEFKKFESGERGANELLESRAKLYLKFQDLSSVLNTAALRILSHRGQLTADIEEFLNELTIFIMCKKAEAYKQWENEEVEFSYDFIACEFKNKPAIAGNIRAKKKTRCRFFHTPEQNRHIENAISLYGNHAGGIGRLIQRSNMRLMFRNVESIR